MHSKSYKGLLKKYDDLPEEIKNYFKELPNLINEEKQLYEVTLAYLFLKIEQAQNRCLYGGMVKIHRSNTTFASRIINKQHLTREGFKKLYKNIFGIPLSENSVSKLKEAEKIRDQVIHGKEVSDKDLRKAIVDCLESVDNSQRKPNQATS